jgi:lipopolysaccharide export LptBFGC system permease protein LptF
MWQAGPGWTREFSPLRYVKFSRESVVLEGPGYFSSELPAAEAMSYRQLRDHINGLRVSGFNAVPYLVELHRKIAFPLITIIMALIAVPFAVTTGKRGAMYGIGAGIVLAILYWTAISVFAGIGSAGLMSPLLAAWAPNVIFGCVALYLLLTVRT